MSKISGTQVKAARALLNWSQEDLAEKSCLTMTPISRMEREVVSTRKGTMKLIAMALEEVGIEFINEEGWVGVKLSLPHHQNKSMAKKT